MKQTSCSQCIPDSLLDLSKYDVVGGPFSSKQECGGQCGETISCSSNWNPDNCIPYSTENSTGGGLYILDPSTPIPPANTIIHLPKTINITIKGTLCKDADGTYAFEYKNDTNYPYGLYVMSTPSSKVCYKNNPLLSNIDASLSIGGQSFTGSYAKIFNLSIKFKKIVLYASINMPVRYRREYGDWTFAESISVDSRLGYNPAGKVYTYDRPPDGGPYDRIYGNPCEPDNCSPASDVFANRLITVELNGTDTCRPPLPQANCTQCINSPSVEYQTLPKYENYFAGCTGRLIDIDFDSCKGIPKPTNDSFSKTNFGLYYQGGANQPFLVIDNVAYDPRSADLIKVFSTNSADEMRNMVCNRLRFATLVDETKLNTDISAALNSNWPYNDLYWYSECSNLPDEVPINLIPC